MVNIIISGFGKMGRSVYKNMGEDFCLLGNIRDIDNFSKEDLRRAVIIDFSNPACLKPLIKKAVYYNVPLVIGTTGLEEEDFELIREASCKIPVFYSANFSLGIKLISSFLEENREELTQSFDIDIIETHRKNKCDMPSGTALFLNEKLKGKGRIHSVRAGDIKGIHKVTAVNENEVLEISHTVFNRSAFSKGALKAAKFLKGKNPGLYFMEDLDCGEN